jgi:phosphoadenosine phosphosulfate reductase
MTSVVAPSRPSPVSGFDTEQLRAYALQAGERLDGAPATTILEWAAGTFGERLCVTASMADAVLSHLASEVMPGVDVVFVDTGYHFVETIGTRDAVTSTLPITLVTARPELTVAEQDAQYGPRLFERDPDACCTMRKVTPLNRTLRGYTAWASGVRRDESPSRAGARAIEWDAKRDMVKINPIVAWTEADVDAYIDANHILVNPLLSDGYGSVGCEPCTRRLLPGESARDGRWAGTTKTECGINL